MHGILGTRTLNGRTVGQTNPRAMAAPQLTLQSLLVYITCDVYYFDSNESKCSLFLLPSLSPRLYLWDSRITFLYVQNQELMP